MQKFSLTKKKKSGPTKQSANFKKIQEKRKKKKETDDPEIEALTARLWPSFDQAKEVFSFTQTIFTRTIKT